MKYLSLETFKDFVCIGSECPYTCCGNWKISIDEETDNYYQTVEGEMGERLKRCIHHEDGKAWFELREDGYCPFLNEKGLCSIYINLGEEHLSDTCTYYPRYMYYAGDICFAGISISCPEASGFYLTHEEPLLIDFAENSDDTNAETDTDWELFNQAIRVFTTSVSIAQNRDFSVKERLALIILLVNGFQECIDVGKDSSELINLYSNPDYYRLILDQTGIKTCDIASKASFVTNILSIFGNTNGLDEKLPELAELIRYFSDPKNTTVDQSVWEDAFTESVSDENEIWRENVLVYILFKYFMKGLENKDFYEKIMTGIGPVLNMSTCITALYRIIHRKAPEKEYVIMLVTRLSRTIEHDFSVGEKITGYFREMGFTDPGSVLKLIS